MNWPDSSSPSHFFATDTDRERFREMFGNEHLDVHFAPAFAEYVRTGRMPLRPPMPTAAELREERDDLRAQLAAAVEERDLAIAHDRQPYPTAWAYEQACAALDAHRERADAAEAERDQLRAQLAEQQQLAATYQAQATMATDRLEAIGPTHEEWGYGDHPTRVSVPLAQGYRNGTPRQWAEDGARRSGLKLWTRQAGKWHEVEQEPEDA